MEDADNIIFQTVQDLGIEVQVQVQVQVQIQVQEQVQDDFLGYYRK